MKKNFFDFRKMISCLLVLSSLVVCCSCSASNKYNYSAMDGGFALKEAGVNYSMNADSYHEGSESYTEITENSFINTSENNKSYFSIDANTSSYPNLRSLLANGSTVYPDAVRVEEMLNYFNYNYNTPENGDILALNASVFDNPYNGETKLLTIGLAAKEVEFKNIKNNLVFLIDTSGSMYSPDKLPLVQQAFTMLAENLNPDDRVSIVTYAGSAGVALEGAYGKDKLKITAVIEDLQAGGSTAGSEGIETAYKIASKYFIKGGNNRVILATDGDFNVGINSTSELERFISKKKESGVYFSVFGVGRGNLKSDIMETLALKGNGTAGYIDSVKEAKRALVEQIGGTMVTVAKDVKSGVVFNSDIVESYRLVGYENKLLTEEQFNDSTTDAGELGSGHTVTVVYEIKLKEGADLSADGEVAKVTLRYKDVDANEENRELDLSVSTSAYHKEMTDNDKFISSVVEFGLILRESDHRADASLSALAERLRGLDLSSDEYKNEFKTLVLQYADR